jgi:hypothetical protein
MQPPPAIAREWKEITSAREGMNDFGICGAGIVRHVNRAAVISVDHGLTWQSVDLGGASPEMGESGYYWRVGRFGQTPIEESRDCGATWATISQQVVQCLDGNFIHDFWRTGDPYRMLYAQAWDSTNQKGVICVSPDDGKSWARGPSVPGLVYAIRGTHWFAGQNDGTYTLVLRSDDRGQSWQSTELRSSRYTFSSIYPIPNPAVLFMVAANGPGGNPGIETLWRWDDTAAMWSRVIPTLPPEMGESYIGAVAVNPTRPQQLFIHANKRAFESRNGGVSWTDASSGLIPAETWRLVFDPTLPNYLYAAWPGGLWALDTSY